jgi:hypothetical protein
MVLNLLDSLIVDNDFVIEKQESNQRPHKSKQMLPHRILKSPFHGDDECAMQEVSLFHGQQ